MGTHSVYVVLGALRAIEAGHSFDSVVASLRNSVNRATIIDGAGPRPVKAPPFTLIPDYMVGQIPLMPTRVPAVAKENGLLYGVGNFSMVITKSVTMGNISVVATKAVSAVVINPVGISRQLAGNERVRFQQEFVEPPLVSPPVAK